MKSCTLVPLSNGCNIEEYARQVAARAAHELLIWLAGDLARVLVIDDESDGVEALCRFLRRGGHDVTCLPNGRKALAQLATVSPDVVVLDIIMPEMDGISFLEVLRNYYRGRLLPVIVLTALADDAHLRRATQLGVKRVFIKSNYDLADLLACISELSAPICGGELSNVATRASLNG